MLPFEKEEAARQKVKDVSEATKEAMREMEARAKERAEKALEVSDTIQHRQTESKRSERGGASEAKRHGGGNQEARGGVPGKSEGAGGEGPPGA
eukprot:1182648-Prorocentrum_minimum.AAC.2